MQKQSVASLYFKNPINFTKTYQHFSFHFGVIPVKSLLRLFKSLVL